MCQPRPPGVGGLEASVLGLGLGGRHGRGPRTGAARMPISVDRHINRDLTRYEGSAARAHVTPESRALGSQASGPMLSAAHLPVCPLTHAEHT
jgi:hypothetical protein